MTLNFVSFFFFERKSQQTLFKQNQVIQWRREKRDIPPSFSFAILTKARTARLHRKDRLAKEIK